MKLLCLRARPPPICRNIFSRSLGSHAKTRTLSFYPTSSVHTTRSLYAQKTGRSPRFLDFTLQVRPVTRHSHTPQQRSKQRNTSNLGVPLRALVVVGILGLGWATYQYVEPVRHLILALSRSTRIAVSNNIPCTFAQHTCS